MIVTTGAMIIVRDKGKRRTAARKQWPVVDHRFVREAS
jgi:hypothetical protein